MLDAQSRAVARDAGLRRSRSLTRWVAVGAAGLTAVFAGIAAQAFHGRTVQRAHAASHPSGGSGDSSTGSPTGTQPSPSQDDGSAGSGLQPPPAPPQPSPGPGSTASSGS
jgi:hypothetical protein